MQNDNEKNVYSDGNIEELILNTLGNDEKINELCKIPGTAFHNFTSIRENLINWYPFKENCSILEIGAGMGALTGYLCSVAKKVIALEESQKRADIIKKRYERLNNLEVISNNFYKTNFSEKFDYVLVIGVLEYVGINESDDPYGKFLRKISSLLKDSGKLLLSIENRFGLKYWCGASEDHTEIPFDGISGYCNSSSTGRYNKTGVRTFSAKELEVLFHQVGLKNQRFFYPLPDYKFPSCIFSDKYLPTLDLIRPIKFSYSQESELIADEKLLYKDIIDNNVFKFFANSYLIEASRTSLNNEVPEFVSFKRDYKSEYNIATLIKSKIVEKKSMSIDSRDHLKSIYQIYLALKSRDICILDLRYRNSQIEMDFCKYPLAIDIFTDLLDKSEMKKCKGIIDILLCQIRKSSEIHVSDVCCFGKLGTADEILNNGYIDLTLINSFYDNEKLIFFDQEWDIQDIPLKFILYRSLAYLKPRTEDGRANKRSLLEYCKISEKESLIFSDYENRLLKSMMDSDKCNIFDPMMYHDGLKHILNSKKIIASNNQEILNRDGHIKQLMDSENRLLNKVTELEKKNGTLTDSVLNLTETANKLSSALESLSQTERRLVETESKLTETESKLTETEGKLAELNVILVNKEGHIRQLMASENDLKNRLSTCENSVSWKLTAPIRGIRRVITTSYFFKPYKIKEFFQYAKYYGFGESLLRSLYLLTGRIHEHDSMLLTKKDLPKQDLVVKKIKSYDKCAVNDCGNPLVSIIIPVYNQFEYTYLCIKSIIENTGDIPYEVIIADDCSTDQTKDIKKIVSGVNVIRNKKNLRFLRNCNNAAKSAKGKYILFLNNDTQVQPNWLKPLVDLIESKDDIGMVGSKLVYPDGTLQEAGGILWKDGSAWNYGRNDSPVLSQYNYVRETDYISGAAIMIKHDLWKEIGGFDERYAPAYCEDSDLAFEVRKRGYRVMYQPLSVVVHFEGKSNGTDVSSGQKSYQVINSKKFYEKWQNTLESEHEENANDVFHARDKSFGKKTILFIDHYVPTFDKDAGSRTTLQYLKLFLKKGFNVKFIGDNYAVMEPYTTILRQMGIEVLDGPYYAQNWQKWIMDNKKNIDFVFFERPHITVKYIDFIRKNTNAKLIYYGHDLHFLRVQRKYELTKENHLLAEAESWKSKEFGIMQKVDVSYYPSAIEAEAIKKIDGYINVKALLAYMYDDVDLKKEYDFYSRKDIMFVGGFGHTPNIDAMLWFVKEVFPKIDKSIGLKFYIAGSNATPEIKKLASENIIIKGFVTDEELSQMYNSCRMVVVPLRYGAGIKGKNVEAMKFGVPIVTTSVGAEGIDGIESVASVIDSVDEMAKEISRLYNDKDELNRRSIASRELIVKKFSSEAAWNIIKGDFE